jgi:hypothetical protein
LDSAGNTLCEIDSFGYIFEDSLQYGQVTETDGISLVVPNQCGSMKPVPTLPEKLSDSPNAKLLGGGGEREAEKYVIGETYSGHKESKIGVKVRDLEEKIRKMKIRYESNHGKTVTDVTSLVGAAILAFRCGPKSRKDARIWCNKSILKALSRSSMPFLWRLAQARRFFLVVLSDYESPQTSALRAIEEGQQSLEAGQQSLEAGQQSLEAGQQSMQLQLDKIIEKLDIAENS